MIVDKHGKPLGIGDAVLIDASADCHVEANWSGPEPSGRPWVGTIERIGRPSEVFRGRVYSDEHLGCPVCGALHVAGIRLTDGVTKQCGHALTKIGIGFMEVRVEECHEH